MVAHLVKCWRAELIVKKAQDLVAIKRDRRLAREALEA